MAMDRRTYCLRRLQEDDAGRMLEWLRDANVTQYLRLSEERKTIESVLSFIEASADESRDLHRAVTAEDGRYYGTVSLKNIDPDRREAEYAIALHPDAIGTSAAKSATDGILREAFSNLCLRRVYLTVLAENLRAERFYRRYGFQYESESPIEFKGRPGILRRYALRAEDIRQEAGR